ncbi:hypothetical protein M433DRAFT_152827 [Acidomyces richmondensis BFW]|nr:MAG: hypothetical protein FE78DRAFT_86059 [Acidomyces sp. 'richmondensis']KYG46900.1 hypothetical protein M433DRAFT_152827 [Acidomyces richmondensis BFW]
MTPSSTTAAQPQLPSHQQPQQQSTSYLTTPSTLTSAIAEPAAANLILRQTNVSQPSLVHSKPSQQSITASEDYYSLSNSEGGSVHSGETERGGTGTAAGSIHRYRTPPERYRTPAQSRTQLPLVVAAAGDAAGAEEEVRKTPMHGPGKRRASIDNSNSSIIPPTDPARGGGDRPGGVPSTVMEQSSPTATATPRQSDFRRREDDPNWPPSHETIDPRNARSSVAMELDRGDSPPTPDTDDTPYIRFALDQLTRDEEVRGSRRYPYPTSYAAPGAYPLPGGTVQAHDLEVPSGTEMHRGDSDAVPGAVSAATTAAAVPLAEYERDRPEQKALFTSEPPRPRNPQRLSSGGPFPPPLAARPHTAQQQRLRSAADILGQHIPQGGDTFIPLPESTAAQLRFLPGILRLPQLCIFLATVVAYTICLIFCAVWSLVRPGIWAYGTFGDARYFVFEYLPTLLGMLLFFWTVQIEIAVYRIAPFIAMASESPRARRVGAWLPLVPKGFLLPFFGHWRAGMGVVGSFVLTAWLQIWTIPLLASSFNVFFFGAGSKGQWRWIATQGPIWTVIALYLLLLVTTVPLMVWLRRQSTGLKWDPRSLADLIVLVERSNALDGVDAAEPAQLGYWRTAARPQEVFHTYGIAEKAARQYSVEEGRIREKGAGGSFLPPVSRFFSDPEDLERGGEQRHSREKMLDDSRDGSEDENRRPRHHTGGLIPWFLHPSMAALWMIIAVVLLLAFLIVSYLPSTRIARGFLPDVPAPVSRLGFSATNFLYSFVPATLGMWALLFWMDIDYAYRRLQVFATLNPVTSSRTEAEKVEDESQKGEVAERSLLLAYPADLPGFVTASAAANQHWRIAVLSLTTLVAATLPILAGGVFWAQFYVPQQRVRISVQAPAYHALSAFAALYALAYFFTFPSRRLRSASDHVQRQLVAGEITSFGSFLGLVRQSRILNSIAFRAPASKIDLVTRLLSAQPGIVVQPPRRGWMAGESNEEAAASKVSLAADSVRGFGRARQQAVGNDGVGGAGVPRYALGPYIGRDGRDWWGLDLVRG